MAVKMERERLAFTIIRRATIVKYMGDLSLHCTTVAT